MSLVLGGVRVLETANFIAGPFAGMLLAELGAEVIKVESPGVGDPFRSWGAGLYSPHYVAYNRGKRSVTLDLRRPEGVELLKRLAAGADVLVENLRPGVAERLGYGYEALRAVNPRLVYCSLNGFGDTGPYADRPAYDGVVQGLSGLLSQLTEIAAPRPTGPSFADNLAGLYACLGVLAALVQRERTGRGQRLVVPMIGAVLSFLGEPLTRLFMLGENTGPRRRPQVAQQYAFNCADDRALIIHLSSPTKFWRGLLAVVGRPELADDPRFVDRDARMDHYDELDAILRPIFRARPREAWLRELAAHDVPAGPVNSLADALEDQQVRHLDLEAEMPWPEGVAAVGQLRAVGFPLRYSDAAVRRPQAPPALGADTEPLLGALGLTGADLESLRARGVI